MESTMNKTCHGGMNMDEAGLLEWLAVKTGRNIRSQSLQMASCLLPLNSVQGFCNRKSVRLQLWEAPRKSQSLAQGRDSRHPGCSCMCPSCISMQMSEWMNEWMKQAVVAGPIHFRPWLWVEGRNLRISLRASHPRKMNASRRGIWWGW